MNAALTRYRVMAYVVGGVGLVTFVRLVRVPHRLAEERERNS